MPIYFIRTPVREPFIFDSIGNHWEQEHVIRPNGYPHYHYLQTESGEGTVRIQGRAIRLGVDEGILIAPFVKHSYMRTDETWNTLFATVTGSLEGSIDRILDGRSGSVPPTSGDSDNFPSENAPAPANPVVMEHG